MKSISGGLVFDIKYVTEPTYPGSPFVYQNISYTFAGRDYPDFDDAAASARDAITLKSGRLYALIIYGVDEKRNYVYTAPKKLKMISADEASKIEYPLTSADRRLHIKSMYGAGKRGIADMAEFSQQFAINPAGVTLTSDDISPTHDILGFDHPRMDILVGKTPGGKQIRTGGTNFHTRSVLAMGAGVVLDNNFTKNEVRDLELYFEAAGTRVKGAAGTCESRKRRGRDVSIISISRHNVDEDVLTHEIVHALRAADGRNVKDRDMDEIATEYETALRVQNPWRVRGYYRFIPGGMDAQGRSNSNTIANAVIADRVLATGATGKPLKGRRLTHDVVPNTIKNSRIATAKLALHEHHEEYYGVSQMIAEDVDTYFQIKLPDRSTTEYHIRFNTARPPLKEIKKHLKEKFGKNIDAWEWKDGKRVRLISRRKKRTTTNKTTSKKNKRTAKKPTTRKTPPKRKIPMTNRPNQYSKGIPPIPGGFL